MKPEYKYLLKLSTDALIEKLRNSDADELVDMEEEDSELSAIFEVLDARPMPEKYEDTCPGGKYYLSDGVSIPWYLS